MAAPDREHLAWRSAQRFAEAARERGVAIDVARAGEAPVEASPGLVVMPLRSLADRVPALQVLELPLLFSDPSAVHAAVDAQLGAALRARGRESGWEILAFWDEGMHALSGNRRFDRRRNLTGVEFLLLRPDPVAERAFHAFDAWTRQARPQSRAALLRECLVNSRAATLQQIHREALFRVHLDLTVATLRYEGWLVAAPLARWRALGDDVRLALAAALEAILPWQREEAARREARALAALRAEGMAVHGVDADERQAFRDRLPAPGHLLPATLDAGLGAQLVGLAGARAAPGGAPPPDQGMQPAPGTERREP